MIAIIIMYLDFAEQLKQKPFLLQPDNLTCIQGIYSLSVTIISAFL